MQTKFMDTKLFYSFVYTNIYLHVYLFGYFENHSLLETQNGVVAIKVDICRAQQNHNFSKYTYEYYTKRGFSITPIVVLVAYK